MISYYVILYCMISFYVLLCYTKLYYIILCYIILHYMILYDIVFDHTILYDIFHIISYYVILYYIIFYYILFYSILFYSILFYYIILYYVAGTSRYNANKYICALTCGSSLQELTLASSKINPSIHQLPSNLVWKLYLLRRFITTRMINFH